MNNFDDEDDWADWSDEQLLDYLDRLYDQECEGADNWAEQEAVIAEINGRGLV